MRAFSKNMRLSELSAGGEAKITGYNQTRVQQKLMEMGCIPGARVKWLFTAPGGDPVAYEIEGYVLSMRLQEAATVNIEII